MRGKFLVLVIAAAALAAAALVLLQRPPTPVGPTVARPSITPAPQPVAPPPQTQPAGPQTLLDLVHLSYPTYPATQPLDHTLPLSEALCLVVHDPVYLDRAHGDLWIQRADSPPTALVLDLAADTRPSKTHRGLLAPAPAAEAAPKPHVHFTREPVVFVHWISDQLGERPLLICQTPPGKPHLLDGSRRYDLPDRAFAWDRAVSWDEKIIVPTAEGISVLTFDGAAVRELASPALAPAGQPHGPAQFTFDDRGLLAWIEPDAQGHGGNGAARFLDDAWKTLTPQADWSHSFLHLVPLADGSVLQIIRGEGTAVTLALVNLDAADFHPATQPTLDEMTLLDGTLELVTRFWDTGAMFYTRGGVSMPQRSGEAATVIPAWLSVRPGQAVQVLPAHLVDDLDPGNCEVRAFDTEIIVSDDVHGPRRFTGHDLVPLLPKALRTYREFLGCDCEGRWLFGKPGGGGDTVIVDPQLPNQTPRLPVWAMTVTGGTAGWDAADWPVIKNGSAYALQADGWRALDDKKEKMFTELPPPATVPATAPAATTSGVAPLLIDAEGTRYDDGQTTLTVTARDGRRTVWDLPPQALGVAPVHLVRTEDGRLFLFNAAGRVLYIQPTPDAKEPFALAATFTHKIPNTDAPTRIWVDPAGRIDILYDANKLAILFPTGRIPPAILQLMPAAEEDSLQD